MTCDQRVAGTMRRCGTHFCYTCGERIEIRPGLLTQHYSGGRCVHNVGGLAAVFENGSDTSLGLKRDRAIATIRHALETGVSPITRQLVSAAAAAAALILLERKV